MTNWGWRRPRTRPLRGEGRGLVTEKMEEEKEKGELRSPHDTEAEEVEDVIGLVAAALRRAAVVGEEAGAAVPAAAAQQTERSRRRSCGVGHAC